jgi:hypothetical protein
MNNREKFSGDVQQGSVCATLLRTVPEIAVSVFKKGEHFSDESGRRVTERRL